ncbi:hypothetical protein OIU85_013577 [Salix viminalis]|uniref:Uncharacterized protein n=1 Tax=Salix viminalis TaxID=40686 RepID=A0A9Q0SCT9_SALVM|nr:hypothetical protein OIU85_013577 [Salix viminalis]
MGNNGSTLAQCVFAGVKAVSRTEVESSSKHETPRSQSAGTGDVSGWCFTCSISTHRAMAAGLFLGVRPTDKPTSPKVQENVEVKETSSKYSGNDRILHFAQLFGCQAIP